MLACTQKNFIMDNFAEIIYDYEIFGYSYKEITLAEKVIQFHKELLKEFGFKKIQKLVLKDVEEIINAINKFEKEKEEETLARVYSMLDLEVEEKKSKYKFTGTCRYCGKEFLDGGITWECVCGYGFSKGFNENELEMLMND